MNSKSVKEGGKHSMYNKSKRFIASFLAVLMAVTILPVNAVSVAYAEELDTVQTATSAMPDESTDTVETSDDFTAQTEVSVTPDGSLGTVEISEDLGMAEEPLNVDLTDATVKLTGKEGVTLSGDNGIYTVGYTGDEIKVEISVILNGEENPTEEDYGEPVWTVKDGEFSVIKNAGTYTVTVTSGEDPNKTTASATLTVTPVSIQDKTVVLSKNEVTVGEVPAVSTVDGKELTKDDYTVSYSYKDSENQPLNDITKPADAPAGTTVTVTVEGKGNYTGTAATATYTVKAADIEPEEPAEPGVFTLDADAVKVEGFDNNATDPGNVDVFSLRFGTKEYFTTASNAKYGRIPSGYSFGSTVEEADKTTNAFLLTSGTMAAGKNYIKLTTKNAASIDVYAAPKSAAKLWISTTENGNGDVLAQSSNMTANSIVKSTASLEANETYYIGFSSSGGIITKIVVKETLSISEETPDTPWAVPESGTTVKENEQIKIYWNDSATKVYYATGATADAIDDPKDAAEPTEYIEGTPIAITPASKVIKLSPQKGTAKGTTITLTYKISCEAPSADPDSSTVSAGSTVELSSKTNGATIYYTTDGTDPSTSSDSYTEAIPINATTTIKAFATKEGYEPSEIKTFLYIVATNKYSQKILDATTTATANIDKYFALAPKDASKATEITKADSKVWTAALLNGESFWEKYTIENETVTKDSNTTFVSLTGGSLPSKGTVVANAIKFTTSAPKTTVEVYHSAKGDPKNDVSPSIEIAKLNADGTVGDLATVLEETGASATSSKSAIGKTTWTLTEVGTYCIGFRNGTSGGGIIPYLVVTENPDAAPGVETTYEITLTKIVDHANITEGSKKNAAKDEKVLLSEVATVAPDAGYELTGWSVKKADNSEVTVTKDDTDGWIFTMPEEAVTATPTIERITVEKPVFDQTVETGDYTFSTSTAKVTITAVDGTTVYYALSTEQAKYDAFVDEAAKSVYVENGAVYNKNNGIPVTDGMKVRAVAIDADDNISEVVESPVYRLGTLSSLTGNVTATQDPTGDISVNDTVKVTLNYSGTETGVKYLYTVGTGASATDVAAPAFSDITVDSTPATGSSVYDATTGITIPTTAAGKVFVKVLAYTEDNDNKVTAVASSPETFDYTVKAVPVPVTVTPSITGLPDGAKVVYDYTKEDGTVGTVEPDEDGKVSLIAGETYTLKIVGTNGEVVTGYVAKVGNSTTYIPEEGETTVAITITSTGSSEQQVKPLTAKYNNAAIANNALEVDKGTNVSITLESATDNVVIYYTLDNSDPSDAENTNRQTYSNAVSIANIQQDTVVKAIATKEGMTASAMLTVNVTVKNTPPQGKGEGFYVELLDEGTYTYTGSAIIPAVKVYNNDELLTEGVDYTVKCSNNVKATVSKKAKLTVTGKGRFSGSQAVDFDIAQKDLASEDIKEGSIVVVSGSKATPVLVYNGVKLANKDIVVPADKYTDATEDKTITVTAKQNGNFTGTRTIPVTVVSSKSDLKKFKVALTKGVNYIYNGTEQTPSLDVTDTATKSPVVGTDEDASDYYVVSYNTADRTNAGVVKFTVFGVGTYTGAVSKSFTIKPVDKNTAITVTGGPWGDDFSVPYTSAGVTFDSLFDDKTIEVKAAVAAGGEDSSTTDKTLVRNKDYKVTYSANKKFGTGKVTLTFIGNYKGVKKVTQTFTIDKVEVNNENLATKNMEVKFGATKSFTKDGIYKAPVILSMDGVTVKNSEFDIKYYTEDPVGENDAIDASKEMKGQNKLKLLADPADDTKDLGYGTVYVVITGKDKGNFAGSMITGSYNVYKVPDNGYDLSKAKITFYDASTGKKTSKMPYTGEAITFVAQDDNNKAPAGTNYLEVTIKKDVVPTSAYEVQYVNNTAKGKATVIIVPADDEGTTRTAAGSKTANFTIAAMNLKGLTDLFKDFFPSKDTTED